MADNEPESLDVQVNVQVHPEGSDIAQIRAHLDINPMITIEMEEGDGKPLISVTAYGLVNTTVELQSFLAQITDGIRNAIQEGAL